jgi:hypothetical protein
MEVETRRADVTTRASPAPAGAPHHRDEIDRVPDGAVHLTVTDKETLKEADT